MARKRPTGEDRAEAMRRLLLGLVEGNDIFDLEASIEELHPRNNTFPGEVFLRLAGDALDLTGVSRDEPIPYEGLREKYLAECEYRGRDNRKIQFAILASAAARGGVEPDLLEEVVWWRADDFWRYALEAAVALIRSCADRRNQPVAAFAKELGARLGIEPERA